MSARKVQSRNPSVPTPEAMQTCVSMLQVLRPKFAELQQQAKIDHSEMESLTNRFKTTVIEMYGAHTQQSERYEKWEAFFHPSYNTRDPEYVFEQLIQKAYQDGVKRTITELDCVVEQLELKLQHAGATRMTASTEIQLILQLCGRLNHSIKVLNRRRAGKQPFEITDEYDVQDLLQAILRAYFKYSISEEPISKLAGSSSRADFAIQDLGIIIEAKYVHGPNEQDRISKQFAEDVHSYSQWSHLAHFIYVIYGADDLKDPELLDQLAGPKEANGKRFRAYIVRC